MVLSMRSLAAADGFCGRLAECQIASPVNFDQVL